MNSSTILTTALILLGLTALVRIVMGILRFSNVDRPPSWLAMVHGLLAVSALTLLVYVGFTVRVSVFIWAGLALLVLAAIGGVVLNLKYHIKVLPLPKSIMILHGILAAIGFVLILVGTLQY